MADAAQIPFDFGSKTPATQGATYLAPNNLTSVSAGGEIDDRSPVEKAGSDYVAPAALGAGNSLLFGAPEFAIKKLGGKEWLAGYIQKHQGAHAVGNVAGTIGSAFIPLVGPAGKLVSGAGAATGSKLLGALGSGLTHVAGTTGALRGALEAGGQQALRSGFNEDPQAASHILGAAATGGITSGLLNALGKNISRAPAKLADMANDAEGTAVQDLVGIPKGAYKKVIRGTPDEGRVEAIQKKVGDLIRSQPDHDLLSIKELVNNEGATWNAVASKADDAGLTLHDVADEIYASPVVQKYVHDGGSPIVQNLIQDSKNGTFSTIRAGLNKYHDALLRQAYGGGDASLATIADEGADAIQAMKSTFDDAAWKLSPELDQSHMKDIYAGVKTLRYSLGKKAMGSATSSAGSKTSIGNAINSLAQGVGWGAGGPIGATIGSQAAGILNKLGSGAVNKVSGEAALAAAPMLREAAASPFAAKLASSGIGDMTRAAAPEAGKLVSALMRSGDTTPEENGQLAAQALQGSPQAQATFNQRVEEGIAKQWQLQTLGLYGDTSSQAFQDFRKGIYGALTHDNPSGGIDPVLAGNVIFQSPEDQALYQKALTPLRQAQTSLETAAPALGGWGLPAASAAITNPTANVARSNLTSALAEILGNSKAGANATQQILNKPMSQKKRYDLLIQALKGANVPAAQRLQMAGVIQ
jgi:hypothetical protein